MQYLRSALVIPLLVLALPWAVSAAPAAKTSSVMLHSPLKTMGFNKAMASATLKYTKHDVTVSLHANRLPSPHVLKEHAYVLWATDGGMKDRVGALKMQGMTASIMGSVMMTKVQDLVVTAESSKTVARPHGKVVLSGMAR